VGILWSVLKFRGYVLRIAIEAASHLTLRFTEGDWRGDSVLKTFQARKFLVAVIHSLNHFDASTVSLGHLRILSGQKCFDKQVKLN